MEKRRLFAGFALLLVAGCLGLVSCGDDDEEENGGGSSTSSTTSAVAVDLGLPSGTKWADRNVGASSPEDYGGYYAWGETAEKDSYTEDNSLTYGLSYPELRSLGIIGSGGILTASYDAATVNWGGKWHMPTQAQIGELLRSCTWTWATYNGVNGYFVEGANGNSIFLPAAGYCGGETSTSFPQDGIYYWCSYCCAQTTYNSPIAGGCLIECKGHRYDKHDPFYGFSVRPVTE